MRIRICWPLPINLGYTFSLRKSGLLGDINCSNKRTHGRVDDLYRAFNRLLITLRSIG